MGKRQQYSDGDVENRLLNLFSGKDPSKGVKKILALNPTWAERYHLSPLRENLLSWYDFDKTASLLEIGAGCGALTGLLSSKVKRVVAAELTKKRSDIIRARYKKANNIEVVSGNIIDQPFKEKFKYITLIGVLEYAGLYISDRNPGLALLKYAYQKLLRGGILFLAIENKFGLKYWAGAREDHTGRLFESLEGYKKNSGIKTFGKNELERLLKMAGFSDIDFYYPLPDYKLPREIFSDKYLPTDGSGIGFGILPYRDFSQPREYLFDEKLVFDQVVANDKFDFFANSFLVLASRKL